MSDYRDARWAEAQRWEDKISGASHRLGIIAALLSIVAAVLTIQTIRANSAQPAPAPAQRTDVSTTPVIVGRGPSEEVPPVSTPAFVPRGSLERPAPPAPQPKPAYVNGIASLARGAPVALLLVEGESGVEDRVASALQLAGVNARTGIFTAAAFRDGIVARLASGDASALAELGLSAVRGHLLVGTLAIGAPEDTGDLLKRDASFSVRVVPLDGTGVTYREFTARGAGFDDGTAHRQAEGRVIDKLVEGLQGVL